jgi:hypothetical protein
MTRQFYAQKQRRIQFETFEVFHPDAGVRRFVLRQQVEKDFTLESTAPRNAGSEVEFEPTGATVTLPEQSDAPTVALDINMARVGSELKAYLKAIENWMDEGEVIYRKYIAGTADPIDIVRIPIQNVTLDGNNAVIRAETPNTAGRSVARISTAEDFPGEVETL